MNRSPDPRGTLYVVATPIGHLQDITLRALEVLSRSRVIACEDTRVTRGLLTRHGLKARLVSCHRFNETRRANDILEVLNRGETAAYVTDGGTPAISDPGAALIRRARDEGHHVVPIPGPSALTALLSVSGWASTAFTFIGFLPHRKGERRRALEAVRDEPRTLLFFESPHRLRASLDDAIEVLGDRGAFLGREMTKIHEEFLSGTLGSIREALAGRTIRGEVAILVEGVPEGIPRPVASEEPPEPPEDSVVRLIEAGWDRKEALRKVARERGISRREIYRNMMDRKESKK
ncbi:MAG: 16S rRNA (cytidine(1402)-2'-O)-methyltransferase [Acidobacteriota bacterium]